MKHITFGFFLLLTLKSFGFEVTRDFRFEVEQMVLKGTQQAKKFKRHHQGDGQFNVGFSTTINEIIFTETKAINLRESLLEMPRAMMNNRVVSLTYETNYAAIGEEITISCELTLDRCSMNYRTPKKVKLGSGLIGSTRTNSFDVRTLEEAIQKARMYAPILDFNSSSHLAYTEKTELIFKIDRTPLEKLFSEAELCENVFFSGGGVYGPGNNICFMTIQL